MTPLYMLYNSDDAAKENISAQGNNMKLSTLVYYYFQPTANVIAATTLYCLKYYIMNRFGFYL